MKRIELVIGLAIAIVLAVGISIVSNWYLGAKQNENRGVILTNASAGISDGVEIGRIQEFTDAGLAAGRKQFNTAKEKAKANEPTTHDRSVVTVPVSVRAAYAERRRARERLGCAGGECTKGR